MRLVLHVRLWTLPQAGVVGVWRMDHRAKLVSLCTYRKAGAVTHVTFVESAAASGAASSDEKG